MKSGCLICSSDLEYLNEAILIECNFCKKVEMTKTRCVNGHYICDECHTKGLNKVIDICLNEKSINPIEIINKIMKEDFCHMHGPEHHTIVGASLLTAYYNAFQVAFVAIGEHVVQVLVQVSSFLLYQSPLL